VSDNQPAAGQEPIKADPSNTQNKQLKQAKIAVIATVGPILVLLGLMAWLSWSPGLALEDPSPAALTPADCSVFVHAPDIGRNLRYLSQKQAVQQFAKSGAPGKFVEMAMRAEGEDQSKKASKTAARMISFASKDVSISSCAAPDARTGAPNELLIVSDLGFSQRVLFNLGKSRMKKADKQGNFKVRYATRGGRTFYVTLAGGFLIAATHQNLVARALDLGMERDNKSIATADFYKKASVHDKHERIVAEWFAPHGAFKSSLTHAKLDYGRITTGGGGVTINFISRSHSEDQKSTAPAMNPAKFLPASVSMLTVTRSFRRIWQDLLLGKAMDPDEAETFMQELYGFGLEDLAEYFDGNVAIAVDGVFKAGDGTPVPSLIFVYKAKDREKAKEKVNEILRKSIKDEYVDRKLLRNQMEYIVFKNDDDESAVIAPSYAMVDDYIFFALTDTQIERILDAAAGKKPNLAGTAAYKAYAPDKGGKQDTAILLQGKELADQAVDYFTWFGDISSPELARALHQAVVPAARMLEYSAGGAGQIYYKDGLMHGTIKFFHKTGSK
jgi:hypothetical protein